jgi:antiphage defense system Thoeris ThsB-like protein
MTKRRIFISYQHKDRMKAKGFNLLRHNKNVEVDFVGRHLLDPVNSTNQQYIKSKIKDMLHGTSVTAVLIGSETCDSKWVQYEIEKSLEKDNPNGIVAIRLEDARLPDSCPIATALRDAGAEIIDWNAQTFAEAIERAALTAGRVRAMKHAADADEACARASVV